MDGLHNMANPFCDGYECECGWTGPMSSAYQMPDGDDYCPVSWCRSENLEPIVLCSKCQDDKAGEDGLCVSCDDGWCESCQRYNCGANHAEPNPFYRDQVAEVKPLLQEES